MENGISHFPNNIRQSFDCVCVCVLCKRSKSGRRFRRGCTARRARNNYNFVNKTKPSGIFRSPFLSVALHLSVLGVVCVCARIAMIMALERSWSGQWDSQTSSGRHSFSVTIIRRENAISGCARSLDTKTADRLQLFFIPFSHIIFFFTLRPLGRAIETMELFMLSLRFYRGQSDVIMESGNEWKAWNEWKKYFFCI